MKDLTIANKEEKEIVSDEYVSDEVEFRKLDYDLKRSEEAILNLKKLREHFEDLAEKKSLTLEEPMENLKESRKQLDDLLRSRREYLEDLLRRTERLGL